MSENVKLINMRQYALERLSVAKGPEQTTTLNGAVNGGHHVYQNGQSASTGHLHQNGYIANHEYGDFDT